MEVFNGCSGDADPYKIDAAGRRTSGTSGMAVEFTWIYNFSRVDLLTFTNIIQYLHARFTTITHRGHPVEARGTSETVAVHGYGLTSEETHTKLL